VYLTISYLRENALTNSRDSSNVLVKSFIRPLFYNCLTLIVIFTLCLYGLGVLGLYLRWFVLEAPPVDTPTPIIVTVVLPTRPGEEQAPIIITVIATRAPDHYRPPTPTLEPTPTQWWPPIEYEIPIYQGPLPLNSTLTNTLTSTLTSTLTIDAPSIQEPQIVSKEVDVPIQ